MLISLFFWANRNKWRVHLGDSPATSWIIYLASKSELNLLLAIFSAIGLKVEPALMVSVAGHLLHHFGIGRPIHSSW